MAKDVSKLKIVNDNTEYLFKDLLARNNISSLLGSGVLTSLTLNTFFAAPSNKDGLPLFRKITASDLPVLNQDTTGIASYAKYLRGRQSNGTYYGSEAGNNIIAEWNTKSDNRWYLKAAETYECRVDYATTSGKVKGALKFGSKSFNGSLDVVLLGSDLGSVDLTSELTITGLKTFSGETYLDSLNANTGLISGNLRVVNGIFGNLTGNVIGNLSGNASTATKLQTAKTLTIGSTGKSFDGSSNVSWTLSEIGAAASSHTHSYLPYSSTTIADANLLTYGLTLIKTNPINAAHTNHSAFLYLNDCGTPFLILIPDSSVMYAYKRYYAGGEWSDWTKMSAGYADSAGNADTVDNLHASDFARSEHTHNYLSIIPSESGSWSNIESTTDPLKFKVYEVYNEEGPTSYGEVLNATGYYNHWQAQLWMSSGNGGRLYYRNKHYNDDSWGNWGTVAWTSDIPTSLPANGGNADTVDGYHASNFAKFYLSPMDSGATAASAKTWFTDTMPSASGAIVYNVPGSEKTIIAGKSSGNYGHMLQLNYDDNYLRTLRYYGGSWKSTDWEKISAGYADNAGTATTLDPESLSDFNSGTKCRMFYSSGSQSTNRPETVISWYNGITFASNNNNSYKQQLVIGLDNPHVYFRNFKNNAWQDWSTVLDNDNYTKYTVKKDGTGASGTWNISITGDSDTLDGLHGSYYHIHTSRSYTSVDAMPSGSEGWYNIFTINDTIDGAIICTIKAYAHTSLTFIASKGWSKEATLQILQYLGIGNSSYFYVKGIRIVEGGKVQALFNKTSGTSYNISVNINIFSSHGTLRPNETLTLETGSPTVIAGPINGTHGKITSDIVGNITGNAATATNIDWSGITNKPNLVNSFGTKTGDITIRGGQTGNGSVNLVMSNNELLASIVGLGSNAYSSTAYLPLAGGTMALGEGLKFHADDNYFGTWADARIISLLDGNGATCDGGLIIDERATYNGVEYVTELLRIRDSEFKWKGNTIWHAGNDGSDSGLDADLLDGKHASDFAISGHNHDSSYLRLTGDTLTGKLTIKTNYFGNQLALDRGYDGGTWGPSITFYNNGTFLACLGVDTNGTLYKGDNGSTNYAIYHTGNLSPMTTSHPANSITKTNIDNWNAVHTWYTTATASDTTNTIDTWKEIEAFVSSFNKGDNLATYLANNYLAKSGGTMTGSVIFNHDINNKAYYIWKNLRQADADNRGERADLFILLQKADGSYNAGFGTYGDKATDKYIYVGYNEYYGLNLRISATSLTWGNNTILHTGNSSVSGNTISINGTSTTWTDTKVTQIISTSNNTDYRPVILGDSSNGSTNSFSTTTSSVLAAVNVYIKPDNGNLYTKGSLNASTTISSGTSVSAGTTVTAATSITSTAGDFYVGGTSGSRCHIKMDTTNKCIKFIFD